MANANNVINKQTDQYNFGHWPFREHTSVTLMLLETAPDIFAVSYEASYSGVNLKTAVTPAQTTFSEPNPSSGWMLTSNQH